MVRRVTAAKFAEWASDATNIDGVLEMIAGGKTLRDASLAVRQPFTCLHAHLKSTPELSARLEVAQQSYARANMEEAREIADTVEADTAAVSKAKLQIEVRQVHAKAFDRQTWGEKLQVDRNVTVQADAGLIGTVGALLLKRRPVVTVESPKVPALPDKV